LNREIHHADEYSKKIIPLSNYDKLNISDCKRLLEKSIDYMISNNFQIEELTLHVKVSYTKIYLDIYYDKKRNMIVMLDIIV